VQVVPAIAPRVAHMAVFQRTPGWTMPRNNFAYSALWKWLMAWVPLLAVVYRWLLYWERDLLFPAFQANTVMAWALKWIALRHLRKAVPDERMRALLTPDYPPGCKVSGMGEVVVGG
jgi:cation diffusion facilitator CzcD-associated flavoprotein CzcO